MKRTMFTVVIACLSLAFLTGVAAAGAKQPTAKFPAAGKLTVQSVPPFFWTFSWPAVTGTFDACRLDLVKTSKPVTTYSFNADTVTRFTVETVSGESYPYCKAGIYTASVSALSKGVVCATLAHKGTVTLK
jgi:hypothetical protein